MKRHTDGFQALAGAIPKSLGQLEATVLGATKSLSEKTRQSGGVTAGALADASVESHLRRSSLGLNLFALACVRAHEKGQLLDTVKFAAAINVNLNSYFAGALAAMHSVNIVRTDPTDSTYQVFKILDVNKHLSERVLPYFMDYITHTYEKKPNMLELWKSNLAKVEALFDNALIPA